MRWIASVCGRQHRLGFLVGDDLDRHQQTLAADIAHHAAALLQLLEPFAQPCAHRGGIRNQLAIDRLRHDRMADRARQRVRRVGEAVHEATRLGQRIGQRARGQHRAQRRVAGADALGQGHEVGPPVGPVVRGQEFAGPAGRRSSLRRRPAARHGGCRSRAPARSSDPAPPARRSPGHPPVPGRRPAPSPALRAAIVSSSAAAQCSA